LACRNLFGVFVVQFSVRENLLVVSGNPESKKLQDMLPDIIKQVGPQQYEALKNIMGDYSKAGPAKTADDDEDDVPPLVQGTFEDATKK
jgi:nascent polypeptide-associated complex subunit beta